MRLFRLFALAVPVALLLPMAAHAATASDWPAPGRDKFVQDCVTAATGNGMKAPDADAHCKCGADTAQKNLSPKEMKVLDSKTPDGDAARAKMLSAVGTACPRK
jgi:hypothetical protein